MALVCAIFYNCDVPKTTEIKLPKELLEQIYAEVEARVEAKFSKKIKGLERKLEEAKEESWHWKKLYFKEQERSQDLRDELSLARAEIKACKDVIEKQAVRIAGLEKQLRGRKTEASPPPPEEPPQPEKRTRGGQVGRKGHGRKERPTLETEECVHAFTGADRLCPKCGEPYEEAGSKSSIEIRVSVRVVRVKHIRKTIRRRCSCTGVPRIKTPPVPPKLFKGSLFSTEFWQYIIYDKYHLQRPLNRTRAFLETHGLPVSQGVITNGLKRLHDRKVFKPLVEGIAQRVQNSTQLQTDETGWKIFQEVEGKKGFSHWLWVKLATDCCLFTIDPSRSREMAKKNLPTEPVVVVSDMLKIYENLGDNVTNAWCWAHVRRYILKLSGYLSLKKSSQQWVERVDWLYHLNNQRLAARDSASFERHDKALRKAMNDFERLAKSYAKRARHPEAKKVFSMIASHWDGLSVFVEQSAVPMDNNASERVIRNAVVGRKNYNGSGALWSGSLAADLFSIFTTLEMNGINPRIWLLEYLTAVAQNNGYAPPNAESFLPWNTPPVALLHS